MIALRGSSLATNITMLERTVFRVQTRGAQPDRQTASYTDAAGAAGFGLYLHNNAGFTTDRPSLQLPETLRYLSDGDIISVSEDGRRVRVIWRTASPANRDRKSVV